MEAIEKVGELIQQRENTTFERYEEAIILAKLKLIQSIYPECQDASEVVFFDEIMKNFAEIVRLQEDMLQETREELEQARQLECNISSWNFDHHFVTNTQMPITEGFHNDKQLRAAFVHYLETQGLSVYTINDYCSRIRNVWKSFYQAAQEDKLPAGVCLVEQWVVADHPMLSAYKHVEDLKDYVEIMLSESREEKRNWANAKAALRRFAGFVNCTKEQ